MSLLTSIKGLNMVHAKVWICFHLKNNGDTTHLTIELGRFNRTVLSGGISVSYSKVTFIKSHREESCILNHACFCRPCCRTPPIRQNYGPSLDLWLSKWLLSITNKLLSLVFEGQGWKYSLLFLLPYVTKSQIQQVYAIYSLFRGTNSSNSIKNNFIMI